MTADISEKGLESLIVADMLQRGWAAGDPASYDRGHALDPAPLRAFLAATQPHLAALDDGGPAWRKLLDRLQGEVNKCGTVEVLRHGVEHYPHGSISLYAAAPSPGNAKAAALHAANRWTVARQLRYSEDERQRSLDLCLFVNGLPLVTFELKNRLTKQTAADAVEQYKRDRSPKEPLFALGRCLAHFALDENEARFCTHLKKDDSWFLPFDRGHQGGAGNPPNPHGLKTDYLWKDVLSPASLADLIENYAKLVRKRDERTGKLREEQIFPRYHQLDVVRRLMADVLRQPGPGRRYLIQHSAGSGKSNSIAWLSHMLAGCGRFDTAIVVTDRQVLDEQTHGTLRQFAQVASVVGHADDSQALREMIQAGKRVIVTTVQKFPHVLKEIGDAHRDRTFALIVDEAHSSQTGKTAAAMNQALGEASDATAEDKLLELAEGRRLAANATYFAFTATPKNKTLELFGEPSAEGGEVRRRPFHSYTMKQAIEEGFILDVLRSYTPVSSYYRLAMQTADDPEYDTDRAMKRLRKYVEGHDHAIETKAGIMADHFIRQVLSAQKVGGQARAMVVTSGIERAIQYFHALREPLAARGLKAIVAFSGEYEFGGARVTEAALNGFPSSEIKAKIREEPYRFLVCADKFQTGYDEPLLHTMYVDKPLAGIKAVQTLSRLNRAHPKKRDVFVLDFFNDADAVRESFADYYKTTVLSGETDPNKLHDLARRLDAAEVYAAEQRDEVVRLFLDDRSRREAWDPILERCADAYGCLDEEGQVRFKGDAKAFVRTYDFLGSVLPRPVAGWERLSILLNLLVPKLPAPREEDLSRGVLESVDMESYRAEKRATLALALADADAEIGPVPAGGGGRAAEPETDRLSAILRAFNDQFGNIEWKDADRMVRYVAVELPAKVAQDAAYGNARVRDDEQNARLECDKATAAAIGADLDDDLEFFRHFSDDPQFRRWAVDTVFRETYAPKG